jgi:hypothetical protein
MFHLGLFKCAKEHTLSYVGQPTIEALNRYTAFHVFLVRWRTVLRLALVVDIFLGVRVPEPGLLKI